MSIVQLQLKSVLSLFIALSLIQACGGSSVDKRKRDNIEPVIPCGDSIQNGETKDVTLYRSERVAFGESCEPLAFTTSATCTNGNLSYLQSGMATCEAATLERLSISAPREEMEVGEMLQLSIEATDQWGGKFPLDPKFAVWSSANNNVNVNRFGQVTATAGAPLVSISAKVENFSRIAVQVTVHEKSCIDAAHGTDRSMPRYVAAKVPFNQTCQLVETPATCDRGNFRFATGFETCEVAQLVRLQADPSTLYLGKNKSAKVGLQLVDEIGTHVQVDVAQAVWSEVSDTLRLEGGRITALKDLKEDASVSVSYMGLSTKILVKNSKNKPKKLSFRQDRGLMKVGDSLSLVARGRVRGDDVDLDPSLLLWESSNPMQVSVNNGLVKALVPDSQATITARLGDDDISAAITVEANLELDLKINLDALITEDELRLRPLTSALVKGPLLNDMPQLSPSAPGCNFTVHKNRGKWEIDLALDPSVSQVPSACATEFSVQSAAGQNIKRAISVPVHYSLLTFTELETPEFPAGAFPVATLGYKLSESVKIESFEMQRSKRISITPAGCELKVEQIENAFSVTAEFTDSSLQSCAGYLVVQLLKDGSPRFHKEFVIVSKDRTFEAYCRDPGSEANELTVREIRKAVAPTADCSKLTKILRKKSLDSVYAGNPVFTLSLANKGLTSLAPLARFIGLKELVLTRNTGLQDISALANLKVLQLLHVKGTAVTDFAPISKHSEMLDLRVDSRAAVACNPELSNPELLRICK